MATSPDKGGFTPDKKKTLEKHIEELEKKLKKITKERDELKKANSKKKEDDEKRIEALSKHRVKNESEAREQAVREDKMREERASISEDAAHDQAMEEDYVRTRSKDRVVNPWHANDQAIEEDRIRTLDKNRVTNTEEARRQAAEENEFSKDRVTDIVEARKQAIEEDDIRTRSKDRVVDPSQAHDQAREEARAREGVVDPNQAHDQAREEERRREGVVDPEEARKQAIEESRRREGVHDIDEARKQAMKEEKQREESKREGFPSEQLFEILKGARTNLINAERALLQARKENKQGRAALEKQLQLATEAYEKARAEWAKKLYQEKVEVIETEIGIPRTDPRFEEHLRMYLPDLYHDVITSEQDNLANERVLCLEPRKRTWFRNMMEKYNQMPTWKRVLIGSAVATVGSAAILGSSVGVAALLGGISMRWVRGIIGVKVGAFFGGLVKTFGGKKVERFRTNEIAAQEGSFGRRIRTENPQSTDEWRTIIRDYDRMYNNTVIEVNRRHRNVTRWATGAGIAAGGLAAWAAGPTLEHYGFGKPAVSQLGEEFNKPENGVGWNNELNNPENGAAWNAPEHHGGPRAHTFQPEAAATVEAPGAEKTVFPNNGEGFSEGPELSGTNPGEAAGTVPDSGSNEINLTPDQEINLTPDHADFGYAQGRFADLLRTNINNPLLSENYLSNLKMNDVISNPLGGNGDNFVPNIEPGGVVDMGSVNDMTLFQERMNDMMRNLPNSERVDILNSGMSAREFLENYYSK